MGIFGTFLSLAWIGGNLINDSIKNAQLEDALNKPGDRIMYSRGKYYDTQTGRQVIRHFMKDNVTGRANSETWCDVRTGSVVYIPSREKWYAENKEWEQKIKEAQEKEDPVFLQEAIDEGVRYVKCVLPYQPGIRQIQYGLYNREKEPKEESEREYFIHWAGSLYKAKFVKGDRMYSKGGNMMWNFVNYKYREESER